jgi:peptidoglycan/LPS O-acetylase OafA/YrhL
MPASHPHLSHPKYRPDIDGLRAIAVLAVVAFHAFPGLIRGGFIGVDVFFVISGFLISTIIFKSLDRDAFSFREFYARRIKRIFPALLCVLIASFTFGWFALLAEEYKQLGKHIAAGAGFVSNFALWSEAGYFDIAADVKPLLHLWSLGIEEQFYIVWPFVLWFSWRRKFNLFALTLLVAAISFCLNVYGVSKDSVATFYSPQTRFWELLCGSMLAWLALYKKDFFCRVGLRLDGMLCSVIGRERSGSDGKTLANVLSVIGFLLILIGFWCVSKKVDFPGKWALLPVLGAVLIIASGSGAFLNRWVLSNKIAVWFGLISFPLYLWHWPILSFLRIMESGVPSRRARIAAVLLSIALAWITYRFIERPIRLGVQSKMKVCVLAVLMFVCGLAGYGVYKADGLGSRASLDKHYGSIELAAAYPHMPYRNEACDNLYPELKGYFFCLVSKDYAPEILIMGDSHSNQYYKSLARKLPDKSVMNLGAQSCIPFSSVTHMSASGCENNLIVALKFAAETSSIKTVYLAGYWSYLASGGFGIYNENYRLPRALTDKEADSFVEVGRKVLAELVRSGKEIIFLSDNPDLEFNVRSCFEYRPLVIGGNKVREVCGMSRVDYEARYKVYSDMFSKLVSEFPSVKVYSPKNVFCDDKYCYGSSGGKPLYYNSDHLTIFGADLVIDDLLGKYPVK